MKTLLKIYKKIFPSQNVYLLDANLDQEIGYIRRTIKANENKIEVLNKLNSNIDRMVEFRDELSRTANSFCLYKRSNEVYLLTIHDVGSGMVQGWFHRIWNSDSYKLNVYTRYYDGLLAFDIDINGTDVRIVDFFPSGKLELYKRKGLGRFFYQAIERICRDFEVTKISGEISCHDYLDKADTEWAQRLQGFWKFNGFTFTAPRSNFSHGKIVKVLR